MTSKQNIFKVVTAGDGAVGKTTLLHRYIKGKFLAHTRMTIGVEFFLKEMRYKTHDIILQLWDFGGQDQFRFLHHHYIKGCVGALLMFDLTRPITLKNLEEWVELCRWEDPDLPIIFLGTKLDLVENMNTNDDLALKYKKKYKLFDYLKTSSKTGENVDKVFELLKIELAERLIEGRE